MTAKEYLDLLYNIVIRHITDESGSYYFAGVLELSGCYSDGQTFQEAHENIREAMEAEKEGISLNQYALYRLSV